MTDDEWLLVRKLLRHTFVETELNAYSQAKDEAYRLSLDAYEVQAVLVAIRRLQRGGQKFVPAVSDILGMLDDDPTLPTFTEVLTAARGCFSGGRALAAADGQAYDGRWAIWWVESTIHPWVAAFFASYGLQAIADLPLDDPQWGGMEQKRFDGRWKEWLERAKARTSAGLPITAQEIRRQLGPTRFDATHVLGNGPDTKTLEAGDGEDPGALGE